MSDGRKYSIFSIQKDVTGMSSDTLRSILSRQFIKSGITIIVALTLLILAGHQNKQLAATRLPQTNLPILKHHSSFSPILLAGFRGLAVDILWLRASDLQDEGRYFELVQLADWITTLEPHLTQIWAVHAWNMAYNISAMVPGDKGRWSWVNNGIHLLRDRGIPLNPMVPHLYSELAFIYLNKIGNPTDSSAQYYKRQWAKEMIALFGESGYPDYSALLTNKEFLKKVTGYNLIPERMQELDLAYGPLDWRAPQTHALYWAHLGNTSTGKNIHDPVCERLIYQSMMALFEHGKLTYNQDGGILVTSTNFELLPKVIATFEEALMHANNDLPQKAYANFLTTATTTFSFYHQDTKARELFQKLHTRFPSHRTRQGYQSFIKYSSKPMLPQILSPREGTTP